MISRTVRILLSTALVAAWCMPVTGCRSGGGPDNRVTPASGQSARRLSPRSARSSDAPIQRVVCLYDQHPWLSLDAAGDRDPEGIHYRVFLDPGTGQGEWRDGMFHIQMYLIRQTAPGVIDRTLASDWHYPTDRIQPLTSNLLDRGYHVRLRWATKDVAGNEIELITTYESPDGNQVRSGTKRLRVPDYPA